MGLAERGGRVGGQPGNLKHGSVQMTIEYRVSEYHWARYGYALARRRGDPYSRRRYYFLVAWPIGLLGLGTFSAFSALSNSGSPVFLLIGFILGIVTLKSLITLRSYGRAIEDTYYPRHLDRDGVRVRLEISDSGIREWQGDVLLSAAFPDVVSTDLEGELLHISLTGLRRIVIPRSSFGVPDLDLESVRATIEGMRGTPGLPEPAQIKAEQGVPPDA